MANIQQQLLDITMSSDRLRRAFRHRPWEEVVTYHLLEAVLRRVSDSADVQELVLRGGMLTRLWVKPEQRIAVDVDFLAVYPFDIEVTRQKFYHILAVKNSADQVIFQLDSLQAKGIWLDTDFPGVRINVDAVVGEYQRNIQIDVGFDDPIVPAAQWVDYPTFLPKETVKLLAVRPETMIGWKLHGLIELGFKRWRPKDLYDLMLLSDIKVDEVELKEAIAVAFSSRNAPLQQLLELFAVTSWWNNSKNRSKWSSYLRANPLQTIPQELSFVVNIVRSRWLPIVESLVAKTVLSH